MNSQWRLDDFRSVIEAVFHREPSAVLVGGQACNFYAIYYLRVDESLRRYLPFTSHDIDIYVPDNSAPTAAAAELHASLAQAPSGTPSPVKSAMMLDKGESELLIQFMDGAYGIKTEDLVDAALEFEIFGCPVRVMHPIFLLQSKLACLKGLDQSDRQDRKHTEMAISFCACFLHELIQEAAKSKDDDRSAVTACQHLFSIANSETGLQVHYEDEIGVELAIPMENVRQATSPKLANFTKYNLDRQIEKLATARDAYRRRRLAP